MTTPTNPTQDEPREDMLFIVENLSVMTPTTRKELMEHIDTYTLKMVELAAREASQESIRLMQERTQQAVREALLSILNDPVLDLNYYTHEGAPSENLNAQEGGEQIVATNVIEYIESKLQEDKQP